MSRPVPDFFTMFDRLLASPSVSCTEPEWDEGNRGVCELLAEWLQALGFRCEIQPMPSRDDKVNLIAVLGEGPGGLVLAGHTDTVPFDEKLWAMDPFGLTVREGRLYGLGATDMKGFFPVAVEAALAFRESRLREPLILVATADEESSMDGAIQLVASGRPRARHAVVGEPTDLRPARVHKGMMMEAITVTGQSGHSSNPTLGRSALEGMQRVMADLLAFREELAARHRNPLFEVEVPTLNLGCIHGGDNPNRICADCELHIDIRPLPGMQLAELRGALHRRLERLLADSGLKLDFLPLFPGVEALETPAAAAIVRAAEELTGAPAGVAGFGTEGPYLNALGMETVILGPGSVDRAHQPDEFLPLAAIQPTLDLLQGLIEKFCVEPE